MKIYALSTLAASALAFQHENTGDVEHPEGTPLDLDASTKLVGIIGWAKIIDDIIDNRLPSDPSCVDSDTCGDLSPSDPEDPDSPPLGRDNFPLTRDYYLCAYRWELWQPFVVSERYALFVGHNCPEEIVESFSFDLSLSGYGADAPIDADRDHRGAIVRAEDGSITVSFDGLLRKTAASSDANNDAGLWLSSAYDSETLAWSYGYSYAPGTWLQ